MIFVSLHSHVLAIYIYIYSARACKVGQGRLLGREAGYASFRKRGRAVRHQVHKRREPEARGRGRAEGRGRHIDIIARMRSHHTPVRSLRRKRRQWQ